jgi:acyl-CoA synthetase (AMP-forming)/AMP-acid ligase II
MLLTWVVTTTAILCNAVLATPLTDIAPAVDAPGAIIKVELRTKVGVLRDEVPRGWLRDHARWNPGRRWFGRVHRVLGPRMRILVTGGSRFDPAIGRDLYAMGFTLLNGYGLTETSGAATAQRPGDRYTTSVGHALPGRWSATPRGLAALGRAAPSPRRPGRAPAHRLRLYGRSHPPLKRLRRERLAF